MATFTRASPSDRQTLATLMHDFYLEEKIPFNPQVTQALDEILQTDTLGHIYLMRETDAVVGYAILTFSYSLERGGRTALLDELYLIPSHRGRGLGKAALAFVQTAARNLGCHTLHLEVDHANTHAQKLYQHAGFQQLPRHYLSLPLTI